MRMSEDVQPSVIDQIVEHNQAYARTFDLAHLTTEPARRLVIVACMDSRLSFQQTLGLQIGDAHFIRNAGGIVTDDVLRSLVLSHRLLGTQEVMIINHTECGLMRMTDEEMNRRFRAETGADHKVTFHAFTNLTASVRQQMERVQAHPWLRGLTVRGFVYDVKTGRLKEVAP